MSTNKMMCKKKEINKQTNKTVFFALILVV